MEGAGSGIQGNHPAPLGTLSRGQINKMRLRDITTRKRIKRGKNPNYYNFRVHHRTAPIQRQGFFWPETVTDGG